RGPRGDARAGHRSLRTCAGFLQDLREAHGRRHARESDGTRGEIYEHEGRRHRRGRRREAGAREPRKTRQGRDVRHGLEGREVSAIFPLMEVMDEPTTTAYRGRIAPSPTGYL